MLLAARKLSASKLRHVSSISLLFSDHFARTPTVIYPSNSSSSSIFDGNWGNRRFSKPSLFFASSFCSSSSSGVSSLTRDGNYDDSIPCTAVCQGCGIHMQDSDPKQPGFFIKPSSKSKMKKKDRAHLVPVAHESEFMDSIKRGFIVEPENIEKEKEQEQQEEDPEPALDKRPPVVCARCHSLRHYGRVKDPTVENLLPDFDFDHTVGRRLGSASGPRTVVLMVVDASDFDGSFPKRVAKIVSRAIEENHTAWKEGKSGNIPRVVLVVTKIDLLPSSLSPTRFEHWVRQRSRESGLSKIAKLHFVSPMKDWGVKDLVEDVVGMVGKRGHVWAVGSQNAGKSTLINAIGKAVGGKVAHLTEAPVPGTTLGIIRVEGVLPAQAKLFDTPGLLNPQQITTRLTRDEQKLVYVSKELKPRTYRIKEGHTIHIGGLMRLDIDELSVDSVYVTVWASSHVPLHMGKKENAHKILEDHFGCQLQPPIGATRVAELGKWVRKEFRVSGDNWESSSVDIAGSGLGWFSFGLKGEAIVGVWTYDGIDVILRNALLPHRSQIFEDTGFTVSKVVSIADQALNKSQKLRNEKMQKKNSSASFDSESQLLTAETTGSS